MRIIVNGRIYNAKGSELYSSAYTEVNARVEKRKVRPKGKVSADRPTARK